MRRQPTREWAVSRGLATMVAAIVLTLPTSALAEVEIAHDGVDCVVAGQFPVSGGPGGSWEVNRQ